MEIKDFINYVDLAITNRDHGDSYWIDEQGISHSADTGYGIEWWDIIKEELIRVFK